MSAPSRDEVGEFNDGSIEVESSMPATKKDAEMMEFGADQEDFGGFDDFQADATGVYNSTKDDDDFGEFGEFDTVDTTAEDFQGFTAPNDDDGFGDFDSMGVDDGLDDFAAADEFQFPAAADANQAAVTGAPVKPVAMNAPLPQTSPMNLLRSAIAAYTIDLAVSPDETEDEHEKEKEKEAGSGRSNLSQSLTTLEDHIRQRLQASQHSFVQLSCKACAAPIGDDFCCVLCGELDSTPAKPGSQWEGSLVRRGFLAALGVVLPTKRSSLQGVPFPTSGKSGSNATHKKQASRDMSRSMSSLLDVTTPTASQAPDTENTSTAQPTVTDEWDMLDAFISNGEMPTAAKDKEVVNGGSGGQNRNSSEYLENTLISLGLVGLGGEEGVETKVQGDTEGPKHSSFAVDRLMDFTAEPSDWEEFSASESPLKDDPRRQNVESILNSLPDISFMRKNYLHLPLSLDM